ncbi:MAG TPA: DJ-1/PfpI family protein [Longimicrobium sp.]|nr:DJ-1/PfpI family protein [Longimicrobium sp.]
MSRSILIGIPLFEGFDMLDVAGPHEIFSWMKMAWPGSTVTVELIADATPVKSNNGMRLLPDHVGFESYGKQLDVLFVPGSAGGIVDGVIANQPRFLAFLKKQAPGAQWVSSVCTGAFLLAASGLLDDRQATTYWGSIADLQQRFPKVRVVNGYPRYTVDRNVVTGGGLSSGLDETLKLVSLIAGDENVGKRVQLMVQYNPHPPYDEGDPSVADYQTYSFVMNAFGGGQQVAVEKVVGAKA